MSRVKNTFGVDTAVTIRRFPKQINIKDYIDDSYTSIIAKYYLELSNCALGSYSSQQPTLFSLGSGDSIFVKVDYSTGAGPLFGWGISESSNMYVYNTDDEIRWIVNGNVVASVPMTAGIHIIGWKGVIENNVKKSQPYFDGDVVAGSSPQSFPQTTILIGGIYAGQGVVPWCYSGGLKIYEVKADTAEDTFHLFPCTAVTGGTTYNTMFETESRTTSRVKRTINGEGSGTTSCSEFPDDVEGIGIQLFDIKHITGSQFIDLIAMLSEDNGLDTECGWTEEGDNIDQAMSAATLTKGSTVYRWAYSLENGLFPTDWTYAGGGSAGYLRRGRKGKWSIWNDIIDFGFYVGDDGVMYFSLWIALDSSQPSGSLPAGQRCRITTTGGPLDKFENYNTYKSSSRASSNFHPPFMRLSTDILKLHLHNGALLRCEENDQIAGMSGQIYQLGQTQSQDQIAKDTDVVFQLNDSVEGLVSYCLGNLVPWNRTQQQMANAGFVPKGVKIALAFTGEGQPFFTTPQHKETAAPYLTSGASQTVKDNYRINGFTDGFVIGGQKWELLDIMTQDYPSGEAELLARMKMVISDNASEDIDCSYFVPPKKCTVKLEKNPASITAGSGRYRMVAIYHKAQGETTDICLVEGTSLYKYLTTGSWLDYWSNQLKTKFNFQNGGSNYTTLYLPFIGCTVNNGEVSALDLTGTDYVGVVELYWEGTGQYEGEYYYASVVKRSINRDRLKEEISGPDVMNDANLYYKEAYDNWKGQAQDKPHAVWYKGNRKWGWITGSDGNYVSHLTDSSNVAGETTDADNEEVGHLFQRVRFIAVNGGDLGFNAGTDHTIPDNSTCIMNVYKQTSSPVFFTLNRGIYDYVHHVPTLFSNSGGNARTYAFDKTFWSANVVSGYWLGTLRFMSYSSANSVYTRDTTRPYYIKLYKNGSQDYFARFDFTSYVYALDTTGSNTHILQVQGKNRQGADVYHYATMYNNESVSEQDRIYGLDNQYFGKCFKLELELDEDEFTNGDQITVEFTPTL